MVEKVTIMQYICGNCLSLKFTKKNFRHQIVCYAGIPWDEKKIKKKCFRTKLFQLKASGDW